MLTRDQILARDKDVTRRLGWCNLWPGEGLRACEKRQGLKKGEHVVQLAHIRVVAVRFEPLPRRASLKVPSASAQPFSTRCEHACRPSLRQGGRGARRAEVIDFADVEEVLAAEVDLVKRTLSECNYLQMDEELY